MKLRVCLSRYFFLSVFFLLSLPILFTIKELRYSDWFVETIVICIVM